MLVRAMNIKIPTGDEVENVINEKDMSHTADARLHLRNSRSKSAHAFS